MASFQHKLIPKGYFTNYLLSIINLSAVRQAQTDKKLTLITEFNSYWKKVLNLG